MNSLFKEQVRLLIRILPLIYREEDYYDNEEEEEDPGNISFDDEYSNDPVLAICRKQVVTMETFMESISFGQLAAVQSFFKKRFGTEKLSIREYKLMYLAYILGKGLVSVGEGFVLINTGVIFNIYEYEDFAVMNKKGNPDLEAIRRNYELDSLYEVLFYEPKD